MIAPARVGRQSLPALAPQPLHPLINKAYSRAGHTSLGLGREALGLGQEGGRIVRRAALGWDGRPWSPGASGPPPPRPRSLRRLGVQGLRASGRVDGWTGRGRAGGGGKGCRGVVSPRGQPWGRRVGERPARLHREQPSRGQSQLPRLLCELRRAPGQRRD